MKIFRQIQAVLAGLLLSGAVLPVALADDIEIYTSPAALSAAKNPNIMFIVDNSGSMQTELTVRKPYLETTDYAGSCERDGIYFVELGTELESIDCLDLKYKDNWFKRSALVCNHAVVEYDVDGVKLNPGVDGSLKTFGSFTDQFAHYDTSVSPGRWRELSIGNTSDRDFVVECLSDSGIHGSGSGNNKYIIDGAGFTSTAPADPEVPHPIWAGGNANLLLYDGNYLNYKKLPDSDAQVGTEIKSRLDLVKRAVEIMVRGNTQVNIGLMVFDTSSSGGVNSRKYDGGSIMYAVQDVSAPRENFFTDLKNLQPVAATQLSESYYEALLYYGGKKMDFGEDSAPPVTGEAKDGGTGKYLSPISSTCDANYIVVLTDGDPVADDVNNLRNDGSENRLKALTGFPLDVCNTDYTEGFTSGGQQADVDDDNRDVDGKNAAGEPSTVDNCLDELATWAQTQDVLEDDPTAPQTAGKQTIFTHTIGFDIRTTYVAPEDQDVPITVAADGAAAYADAEAAETERVRRAKAAVQLLKLTAKGGEGDYYGGETQEQLIAIFDDILAGALDVNTTFSSPAVSVNAFNRSTHLDDLYFTLFRPSTTKNSWKGNLKRYKLKFTDAGVAFIAGQDGVDAVSPTSGFFAEGASSYWSSGDGKLVEAGGAAGRLTATRNVYTITGAMTQRGTTGVYEPAVGDLTSGSNEVVESNTDLTDGLLNITGRSELLAGIPYRETLIDWISGLDVFSNYGAVDTVTDARLEMGDPLHAEPALVQYGTRTVAGKVVPDLVAYVATNDGYLHAIDTAEDKGTELFSFIPQELLSNLPEVMENSGGDKTYGLDGNVVAWIHDNNDDNEITTGASGDRVILYIGMRRGGRNIYAVDVTDRTSPQLLWAIKGGTGEYTELGETWSTVNVEKIKVAGTEKTVLIFGGGYDQGQDNAAIRSTDNVGRTIYIADAETGERLWSAVNTDMTYSIPARIKPLDISGDGYIDRLYAVDMGGQIFRFDINNTATPALSLSASITGARIADFAGATAADARRFYYPPDVALVDGPDGRYHGVLISSGFRAHPLNKTIHDRIYMFKDRNTGLLKSNTDYKYNPDTPTEVGYLTESHLKDVTNNLAGGDSGAEGNALADAARATELANITAAEGWYISLNDEDNAGAWIGEKGLAEPLIIEGIAIVTTFIPAEPSADSCTASEGTGRVYYLDILDATPAYPSDSDVRKERYVELKRGGIPPPPTVIITTEGVAGCIGTECPPLPVDLGSSKTYWYEVEK